MGKSLIVKLSSPIFLSLQIKQTELTLSSINKDGTFLTHFTPHRYKIWHFDKRIKDDGDGARQRTTKTKSKLKSEKKNSAKQ